MTIERVFQRHHSPGLKSFIFPRSDLTEFGAAADIVAANGGEVIANDGDVIYAYRFRRDLPKSIRDTQPEGLHWRIQLAGRAKYRFKLSSVLHITPNTSLVTIKVPDATPEIIVKYALTDEQALLAKVRYNRLVDIFLGITTYSMQNHLRTAVEGVGQIEIDEFYVGLDRNGRHYVIPVQAKGGTDKLSPAQAEQDIAYCAERFGDLVCRSVSAQFMGDDLIAMFELAIQDEEVRVVDEKHYKLVPAADSVPNPIPGAAAGPGT